MKKIILIFIIIGIIMKDQSLREKVLPVVNDILKKFSINIDGIISNDSKNKNNN